MNARLSSSVERSPFISCTPSKLTTYWLHTAGHAHSRIERSDSFVVPVR